MWCDAFDADLLKAVPGAAEALGSAVCTRVQTYCRTFDGHINCPSSWNTEHGSMAFFWTAPQFRPGPYYMTTAPVAECTFLEAVRDEWAHHAAINVNGHLVWRPPVRPFERLMFDLRGWTVLADEKREQIRASVRLSLKAAAARLAEAVKATEEVPQ